MDIHSNRMQEKGISFSMHFFTDQGLAECGGSVKKKDVGSHENDK